MESYKEKTIDEVVNNWNNKTNIFVYTQFLKRVVSFFQDNPKLTEGKLPIIHSIKYRLKDPEHLRDKLLRKWSEEDPITKENMFNRITDFAGIRILHIYQGQFPEIHAALMKQIEAKEWCFAENPVAYTWDPESTMFFSSLGIECKVKDSQYTSIHYLLKPNEQSDVICELQVRTLFEEIWGEIDHAINYPHAIDSISCKTQLRTLAKLSITGTKMVDAIFATKEEIDNLKAAK